MPRNLAQGKISKQFAVLAGLAEIGENIYAELFESILDGGAQVERLIASSFLDDSTKRSYWQSYQSRMKQLRKLV
ncbi:hypothetical protein [Litoribacter populi]|uniref:hypothetical protein n=1 Tax=Litoribacter populi TaxID=2598460 RepID=UPI001F246C00